MKRAIVLLFDSFGIGASLDAEKYGDEGADTFGHIAEWAALGKADTENRKGPLNIPNLTRLGITAASLASTGARRDTLDYDSPIQAHYGYAVERSFGKDTPSGHWEIAGLPVEFEWGYFKPDYPSFPEKLITTLCQQCDLPGVLGNCHASGTTIIEELGEEHIQTGKPIVYTSGDSVFQIAAHETHFGLDKLYEICKKARVLVDEYKIGRVIARPFVGDSAKTFKRTSNRQDYATPPHGDTLFDVISQNDGEVIAIGKTADIYANRGVTQTIKGYDNLDLFEKTLDAFKTCPDRSLIFSNFVDFDSKFGHRRDPAGYAEALEVLDKQLPRLEKMLQPGDMVVITADHGCDPTFPGSDHTREHIPVLVFGPDFNKETFLGRRESFADIGQSIAEHLSMPLLKFGVSFLNN